jgi:hypothetical protein
MMALAQRLLVSARRCRCSPRHRAARLVWTAQRAGWQPAAARHLEECIAACLLFRKRLRLGCWLAYDLVYEDSVQVVGLMLRLVVCHVSAVVEAAFVAPVAWVFVISSSSAAPQHRDRQKPGLSPCDKGFEGRLSLRLFCAAITSLGTEIKGPWTLFQVGGRLMRRGGRLPNVPFSFLLLSRLFRPEPSVSSTSRTPSR